jgi:hypothetical protein
MQKSSVIMADLRKTESNLMGEISKNVERGNFAIDEDDKELQRNRKQIANQVAMLKSNKNAILGTVDALAMAQKQMGEQSSRMDALRNVVQQQADKGFELEKVSRSQATELRNLKGELDRLQILLRTREQEALMEGKAKNDQITKVTNQLATTVLKSGKQHQTNSILKSEIEKLKIMLASAERVNAILMGKETDEKLKEMVEIEKTRANEMAELKMRVMEGEAVAGDVQYISAMQDLTKQLTTLGIERAYRATTVPVATDVKGDVKEEAKGDGKVYPEGVKPEVKEKKSGGCVIL